MSTVGKITRRTFMLGSAAIAGGVLFGYYKYQQPYANPLLRDLPSGDATLTPYVVINKTGITIIAPRAEMGQGVRTSLAALVAEELDVDVQQVNVEHGPASKAYYNTAVLEEGVPFAPYDNSDTANSVRDFMAVPAKFFGIQVTGGSSSTADAFEKMRVAGASARLALVEAAAAKLNIPATQLKTENAMVIAPDGAPLAYSELAELAASIPVPEKVTLKPQSQWQQIGHSLPKVDMVAKCTGTAEFGIDVTQPNMRFATVKMNPHLGGKMRSFDASKALTMRGVEQIIPIDDQGVAVVASNTWYAFKAAEAISFEWEKGPMADNTASLFTLAEACFNEEHQDSQNRNDGDVERVFAETPNAVIEREYRAPMLAHATMEPMNATALIKDGYLDIWVGTQSPTFALAEAEKATGIPADNIRIHTTYLGGGFGRRIEMDFIIYAAKVAREMPGTPVKVTWTREEDMTHDFYRPFAISRFKAVHTEGKLTAIDAQMSSPSVVESQMGRLGLSVPGPDSTIVQAAWEQPYMVDNYRVTGFRVPQVVPVSSWRSVGASQNGFFNESMLDEVAHEAGVDPLTMRLQVMTHKPSRKVLETVATMANWGTSTGSNRGMGLAFVTSFGVPVAEIIEVEASDEGIKILNVWVAADVGIAIDPRNVDAQLISGINFGLAAAMMGEITLTDGKVDQTNFHNFDSIRMYQAPHIHTKVLENGERIKGIGEPGTPPAAPALANAIFAATGQRIREMPFNQHVNFV